MASQGSNNSSRLAQMQMRFQEKQQQEREQRRVEMTSTKLPKDEQQTLNSSYGRGKVRQMFEQRRGVDKSYPLKPISNTTTTTMTRRSSSGGISTATITAQKQQKTGKNLNNNRLNATITSISTEKTKRNPVGVSNGNASNKHFNINNNDGEDLFRIENNNLVNEKTLAAMGLDNDTLDATLKLPNVGKLASLTLEDNKIDNKNNNSINNNGRTKLKSNIKLKPVVTRKTLPSSNRSSPSSSKIIPIDSTTPTQRVSTPAINSNIKTPTKSKISNEKSTTEKIRTATPPGMTSCKICHRHFNPDRIQKHQEICQKTATKKRKAFDAVKHRVKGTEAEIYVKRIIKSKTPSSKATASAEPPESIKNTNWRKKHEEFISAIRAAKKVQDHLAKGGKLSDLPPPPPSENADYVQCPHCMRRFNESAASRHIPKCATMLHNKPKPSGALKKRF